MNYKIGFIGAGNMAFAIIGGLIKNKLVLPSEIIVSDSWDSQLEKVKMEFGVDTSSSNNTVANSSEVIFFAIKPQYYEEVLLSVKDDLNSLQTIISIAPGKTISWLENLIGQDKKIVRTMPNTPALVCEGMTGVCLNNNISKNDKEYVLEILSSFGKAEVIPENLMTACVTASGSSPAYVFMLIEAMADAAVLDGMPRDKAYNFVAQAVLGSAKMVLETGIHPGKLKDMVCSPGGTTIEAVRVLEERGFRSSIIEAMVACGNKARSL